MIRLPAPPDSGKETERSWWLQDVQASLPHAPLQPVLAGEAKADVAIVGGGYTGMWAAWALLSRRPSLRVAVLDAYRCGEGASSRNGGKVHGYWSTIPRLSAQMGHTDALTMARLGDKAQDLLRVFCTGPGRDCWWREAGNLLISTSPAQDAKIAEAVAAAELVGAPETVQALSAAEVAAHIKAPQFRGGILYREGATLHPARLAYFLRAALIERGCRIYEGTPVLALEQEGDANLLRTPGGQIRARDVVLANNVGLAGIGALAPHLTIFSSYAAMSEPAPEEIAAHGWNSDVGAADLRMFLHYFRKAGDRVLMGAGSGPICFGAALQAQRLTRDMACLPRPGAALQRLLPAFAGKQIARRWGWPIDVASDRLPFAGRLRERRIFYGGGFSGHGVNPTLIIGQCLASLVLEQRDEWTFSPFCTRRLPALPPEPLRYIGGSAVRWGILNCEDAEEAGHKPGIAARMCAEIPRLTGMSLGLR